MADSAYKIKQDITIPRPTGGFEELPDGTKVYDTESVNYGVGDYVLEENISPPVLERIQGGDLEDFLESADRSEAEAAARAGVFGTFIPEHSNEAYILDQYGHTVVPREQVVALNAAGNEGASNYQEEVKSEHLDERNLPGVPEEEVAEEQVPDERPPGIQVGDALAEASTVEGSAASQVAPTAARARRARPQQKKEGAAAPAQQGAARPRPAQQKPEGS